jgi:hypothetical protein
MFDDANATVIKQHAKLKAAVEEVLDPDLVIAANCTIVPGTASTKSPMLFVRVISK